MMNLEFVGERPPGSGQLHTWLATCYGFDLSPTQATQAAGVILAVGSLLARSTVRTKRTLLDPDATRVAPPRG